MKTLLGRFLGRGAFPARYARFLEGPWRRLVLSPDLLIQRLALAPELTVLEIGVGGGYYAQPISALVRRFIALDLQAEMLGRLRQKPVGARVLPVQADAVHLPLAASSMDAVLAITVLGEVPSAETAIREIRRVLRPGGILSVSEHWPDPDFLTFTRLEESCRRHQLLLQDRYGPWFSYTANFRADTA
ncbi:MAG: class I SAM-dependent methyltransferase [Gemmatimonadales bacterium]